ncbi:GntR family transcriptional regulator [Mucilaginibacter pocheonensis]|uniref:DNA-binding transcriptional regulator YhcF (GntR family) n=1 Tax=Mucilaginibacter pocheonensis TaxID=398050 RepID=A0ABU1TC73_9SPHI|nr:GntR family transcriptional regulator [Mucilaginibacter pocheonensis]MDR6942982.1 DNA-binding transcriptional regulator YhcF (GntR family) [Mucilaginibacter pocheonensis]
MLKTERTNYDEMKSLVQQIANSIKKDIDKGIYRKNDRLLSINAYSKQYKVARDTIEKAYIQLKQDGYIHSVSGKGYFVIGKTDVRIRVLLIFNKLSSYKKVVYDAIVHTLGDKAKVDLHIHHYNPALLEESIEANIGAYHYYVVMPHFFDYANEQDYLNILKKIPTNQLILLDRDIPKLDKWSSVYQDFKSDIYDALNVVADRIAKYKKVIVVYPADRNHPPEIKDGVQQFCLENNRVFEIITTVNVNELTKGAVYIVLTEHDLADLIKGVRITGNKLGRDIGIISFNETVFKELLDITVISTDFEGMGRKTAELILQTKPAIIKNEFKIIIRKSL